MASSSVSISDKGHDFASKTDWQNGRLSQEIVDEIIEFGDEDEETLKACSLTCRSWVEASQTLLHSCVRLTAKSLLADPNRYSNPDVAKYVETLMITGLPSASPGTLGDPTIKSKVQAGWDVLARLSKVETLMIRWLDMRKEDPASILPYLLDKSIFPIVEKMVLPENAYFASFHAFAQFITSFPSLGHLEIQGLAWPSDESDGSLSEELVGKARDLTQRLSFLAFKLTDSDAEVVSPTTAIGFAKLIQPVNNCSITQFTMLDWSLAQAPTALSSMFQTFGPSLTTLELSMDALGPTPAIAKCGFQYLSNLETLQFQFFRNNEITPNTAIIPAVLAQVNSRRLIQVILMCEDIGGDNITSVVNWYNIDDAVEGGDFDSLQRLVVVLHPSDWDHGVEDRVEDCLPYCMSRGIVFMEFADLNDI
ncbi:hypothetical protein EIP91_011862 [Steccherinum ochraceum]|uniref:F-box domain-containing protein n=1 Tax=Steccherinum ochraceum TaxID=92696 RepID=A0A4R0RP40_9APHY|nr:hypothetical protein EIP91_011862 [Steccherinum ochraceum]